MKYRVTFKATSDAAPTVTIVEADKIIVEYNSVLFFKSKSLFAAVNNYLTVEEVFEKEDSSTEENLIG